MYKENTMKSYEWNTMKIDGLSGDIEIEFRAGEFFDETYIAEIRVEEAYRESYGHSAYITTEAARVIIDGLTAALEARSDSEQ